MLDPRDRSALIQIVERQAPVPAVARACLSGEVEVLGGFDTIPPGTLAGWIVTFTAAHGTVFHVALIADIHKHEYRARLIETVPWQLWIGGQVAEEDEYSIYAGDHPEVYQERREKALDILHFQAEADSKARMAAARRLRKTGLVG
jgi:hypothetical protein